VYIKLSLYFRGW